MSCLSTRMYEIEEIIKQEIQFYDKEQIRSPQRLLTSIDLAKRIARRLEQEGKLK